VLIIAEDIEGEALATLVVNKLRGTLKVAAVKAPGFGDRRKAMLEDIAIVTGGRRSSKNSASSSKTSSCPSSAGPRKSASTRTTPRSSKAPATRRPSRAASSQLKNEIDNTTSDYDREKLQERLAKLAGGVAQINVGAATEVAMKEKKARVEDALHACRAAVEEGILPGGGVSRHPRRRQGARRPQESRQRRPALGIEIVRRAIEAPIKQIAENAGVDGSVVAQKVKESTETNFGYNALTHEYGDLLKMGVIVPTKVERTALQNAASIASLLLTTDAIVSEIKEDKPEPCRWMVRKRRARTRSVRRQVLRMFPPIGVRAQFRTSHFRATLPILANQLRPPG
jgi:chaperonin GroEL